MVAATATTNGKFLRDTQAGQGFSRIDYLSVGTGNFIGVNSCLAGHSGQQLQTPPMWSNTSRRSIR